MLLSEQHEQGVIDLRPEEGATWLVREDRNLTIGRVKQLENTVLPPGSSRDDGLSPTAPISP
jgi:hypothetical protein